MTTQPPRPLSAIAEVLADMFGPLPGVDWERSAGSLDILLRHQGLQIATLDAAREPAGAGLREAALDALDALEMLHSPHFGWGCNDRNCSGVAAIHRLDLALSEPKP